MADAVYTVMTVALDDGTEVVLKPLVISRLRKFMEIIDGLSEATDVYDLNDRLFNAAVVCLEKHNPDVVKDIDELRDNIDMITINKVLEVCGGIKFNDPNLMTALAVAAAETEKETPGEN